MVPLEGSSDCVWAGDARKSALRLDRYYAQRIVAGDGWWPGQQDPYYNAVEAFTFLCRRGLILDMLGSRVPGGTILDSGGGEGFLLNQLLDQLAGWDAYSLDLSYVLQVDGKRRHASNELCSSLAPVSINHFRIIILM